MPAQTLVAGALARLGRAALTFARSIAVRLGLKPEAVRSRALAAGLLTVGTALSVSLLAALGPALAPHTVEAHPMEIAVAAPDLSSEIGAVSRLGTYTPKHYEISSSDTIFSLFAKLGIHDDQARDYIFTQQRLTPFLAPQPGQHVTAGVSNAGQLEYMRLYLDGAREDNSRTIEVSRIGRELISNVLPFTFSTMETRVSGDAVGNLDATARELHIPESVTDQLRAVWGGADDPVEHLTAGSSLRLVYEKKYADGRFVRNGQLLAAQIVDASGVHEAFWFSDGRGAGSFYTLDGRSASQTFLRVPLDFKDVSSEFAPLRRHPVTGVLRPHNGTDFRAPSGSRILAAADGRVTRVAYEARGYGHYVQIDHGLNRTTLYAHMRRVAKGIRPGVIVKKGDEIGYVGMTGLATGPHLHYELQIDGVQINPATADLPDTENLSAYQLAQLRASAQPLIERFERAALDEGRPSPQALLAKQAQKSAAERDEEADQAANAAGRVRLRPVKIGDLTDSSLQEVGRASIVRTGGHS